MSHQNQLMIFPDISARIGAEKRGVVVTIGVGFQEGNFVRNLILKCKKSRSIQSGSAVSRLADYGRGQKNLAMRKMDPRSVIA